MESAVVHTVSSNPYESRKHRVRYTAYYQNSQKTKVLYSGSEQGYQAFPNLEEIYIVLGGSPFQVTQFMLDNPQHKIVVHKENWSNSLGRRSKEPWFCKRSGGDYPRPDEMYQSELSQFTVKTSKHEG